ncbi:Fanconi anemia group E protein [Melia azedarach]|uniref:Fanconi anemia group E protein n=1 Tax=Melia azedarach TaxID=155640 RepID=A0ACC1XB38_MELAZ|nr:Fanconi anemia group E protein [Melia azedarach]
MESWVPLMDIFLNSPTPETEASLWLQQFFGATSSSSSTPITTSSFIALLTKPCSVTSNGSSSSPATKTVMFIQTLPAFVQSRILSFLAFEYKRFCGRELCRLARDLMSDDMVSDFWVQRAARNLLDVLSDSNYQWISGLTLDSEEHKVDEEFEYLPGWIKDTVSSDDDLLLPWLPISLDELNPRKFCGVCELEEDEESASDVGESVENEVNQIQDCPINVPLQSEIENMAGGLREQIMNFESSFKTVGLAHEIRQFCLDKGGDSFAILGLVEPWKADDETASVLISHLSNGSEDELVWPSQVLCSVLLPKLLVLEEPASRVLVSAMIEYCKIHQRAAVYALLGPLMLRREGINNPICDVVTRIVKECLHPAHVSAFLQKLLCGGEDERRFICLPHHQCLISNELAWTESLFTLFQNILNHNVHFTQDSVDHMVYRVRELAERYTKSLKFGNFLLCLANKCSPALSSHKLLLIDAVEHTNTIVTKSILLKLASL